MWLQTISGNIVVNGQQFRSANTRAEAGQALFKALKIKAKIEDLIASMGLGARRAEALLALKHSAAEDGLKVSELCRELAIQPNTGTELVKRMEADGLVQRRRSKIDQRLVKVTLAPEGEALLEKLTDVDVTPLEAPAVELQQALDGTGKQGE